jgi:RHS repeat-associated protein
VIARLNCLLAIAKPTVWVSESRAYNTDNTLASISFTGAAIGDLSYGWDANKNKTSEAIGGVMSGYGFSVGSSGYDDEVRLVNWQRTDTNLDQSWNLSAVGNWNSITENSSTQNRTHGPAHEMLTVASQSVTHDAKGNMTLIPAVLRPTNSGLPPTASRLTWDFETKLIAADTDNDSTDDIFYKFDALGRRVGRDDGTANVVYFQDGQQTIADYPPGTAASSPTYTYVYASYIDEPVMRGGSGGLRYYHRNQQYSITAVSDGGGSVIERYAYSAYGQVTITDASGAVISGSAITNRYTYTGREWDEGLSLYHFRARLYDALGGRFGSRDSIGYVDGFNIYRFGAVVNSLDPSGHIEINHSTNESPHSFPTTCVTGIDGFVTCRPSGPDPCSGVCEAYMRLAMQLGMSLDGGGVLCRGKFKCACVYGYPQHQIFPGKCKALDEIIRRHEFKHFVDVDCNYPCNEVIPAIFTDPDKAIASECEHRKASAQELDNAIDVESDEECIRNMKLIKNEVLDPWIKLHCPDNRPFDPFG